MDRVYSCFKNWRFLCQCYGITVDKVYDYLNKLAKRKEWILMT
jgi:hypothetical protein